MEGERYRYGCDGIIVIARLLDGSWHEGEVEGEVEGDYIEVEM